MKWKSDCVEGIRSDLKNGLGGFHFWQANIAASGVLTRGTDLALDSEESTYETCKIFRACLRLFCAHSPPGRFTSRQYDCHSHRLCVLQHASSAACAGDVQSNQPCLSIVRNH